MARDNCNHKLYQAGLISMEFPQALLIAQLGYYRAHNSERAVEWNQAATAMTMEPEDTIRVIKDLGVLVCQLCQYGVRRRFLSSHFRTKHGYTAKQARVLSQYSQRILPCETTIDHRPNSVRVPYPELTFFIDGLLCTGNAGCTYICRTEMSMKAHIGKEHPGTLRARRGRPSRDEALAEGEQHRPWRFVHCQRLFASGHGSAYFEIQAASHPREFHVNDAASNTDTSDLGSSGAKSFRDNVDDVRLGGNLLTAGNVKPAFNGEIELTQDFRGFDRGKLKRRMDEPEVGAALIEAKIWKGVQPLLQTRQDTHELASQTSLVPSSELQQDIFEVYDPYDDVEDLTAFKRRFTPVEADHKISETKKSPEMPVLPFSRRTIHTLSQTVTQSRPYLSLHTRQWLQNNSTWHLLVKNGNEILHVDFSVWERKEVCDRMPNSDEMLADEVSHLVDVWSNIAAVLPGRSGDDVQRYWQDLLDSQHSVETSSPIHVIRYAPKYSRKPRNRIREVCARTLLELELGAQKNRGTLYEGHTVNMLKPYKYFDRASGDIQNICFSPAGDSFVFGCVTTDDAYNRAGNLVLSTKKGLTVLRHNSQNSTTVYPTITSVKYVQSGQHVVSGGNDGTVKLWSRNGSYLRDVSRKRSGAVNHIGTSDVYPAVFSITFADGALEIYRSSRSAITSHCTYIKSKALAPSIAVFGHSHWSHQIVAGYESRTPDRWDGVALVYDVHAQKLVKTMNHVSSYAHLCSNREFWLSGTNHTKGGHVRLYNAKDHCLVLSCETPQRDINEVTIRLPYFTSSATDGSTFVWDIRRTNRVLHVLRHGESRAVVADGNVDDGSGVTSAIWLSPMRIITGGSDGAVKLWDVSLSNPFVRGFAIVDSPITSMALSPSKEELVIGENRGAVHLWSIRGEGDPVLFQVDESTHC